MTTLTLHGADGSTWELMDHDGAVQLLGGMGGLHLPASSNQWTTTARASGRRFKGSTTDYRQFSMTVRVGDSIPPFRTGDDWRRLDGLFWRALSHNTPASLVFNGTRTLNFRLDDDNDTEYPKDPALMGKAVYSIACVADEPEWLGTPVTATFNLAPTAASNYYGASQGPPFTISAPTIGRTGSVSNPGDMPAYPIWRIIGPATTAAVGIGDQIIQIPFALQAGQQVIINTRARTITDGAGTNLWPLMGYATVPFAPVPSGGQIPISIGLEDGGATSQISITLTPRYRRAWGVS